MTEQQSFSFDEKPQRTVPRATFVRKPIDITANYHRGNPESIAARDSIEHCIATLRQQVKDFIRRRGSAICDQVEVGLGMVHQTASARMTELKSTGEIVPTGRRLRTRSGRVAAEWRLR